MPPTSTKRGAAEYRRLYYRLHAEVDGAIDAVRRAVTDGGSDDAVIVLTADHGELLGAHGGLHQKWFNLYEEATRVPFVIARIGRRPTIAARRSSQSPTSHVDLVPTLLSAAASTSRPWTRIWRHSSARSTRCPGRDLMPVVDGAATRQPTAPST